VAEQIPAGEDADERRRRGLELQARIPAPRWGRRRPQSDMSTAVDDGAEIGCLAAEGGPKALAIVAAIGAALLVGRRRRRTN
jgi:MYXO-CTERM domain-containing protein